MTSNKSLKFVNILDVKVNSTSYDGLLRNIRAIIENSLEKDEASLSNGSGILSSKFTGSKTPPKFRYESRTKGGKFYIVTPNPEITLNAFDDELLKRIINEADFSIPDGIGLIASYKFLSLPRPQKVVKRIITLIHQGIKVGLAVIFDQKWLQSDLNLIKGRKVFEDLIILANKKGWKVVMLGDVKGKDSAQKAAKKLKQNYKNVKISAFSGPSLDKDANPKSANDKEIEEMIVASINRINPDLLFIGFGSPRQEKWLYRWFGKMDFKGAMVVGGTFDYISGIKKFPPKWVEAINLEWLWRLIKGDQKLTRIISAFPRFAFRIFISKLVNVK
jgi:N-acetylglucosaminyldiphosphoundecaprenol N-acetyl-beta-D-mannosaminyltransferase